jgi:hypothetical protein
MRMSVTTDEVRALARGEVEETTREKALRLLEPTVPPVIDGQTTIDDHLEGEHGRAA